MNAGFLKNQKKIEQNNNPLDLSTSYDDKGYLQFGHWRDTGQKRRCPEVVTSKIYLSASTDLF